MPADREPLLSDIGTRDLRRLHPKTIHDRRGKPLSGSPGIDKFPALQPTPGSKIEPKIAGNSRGLDGELATSGGNCV
jgi:hypothetical protein